MPNFKITLEYDGAAFNGWQIQSQKGRTVQGVLKQAADFIFKQDITIIGSGRTDSGVHALGQVAHFKADTRMKPDEVLRALNSRLPQDVVVREVKQVADDFHAQYSVRSKTYRYTILNAPLRSVFVRDRAYFYPHKLNLAAMRRAAKALTGKHDFKSFQAHDALRVGRDTVRTIKKLTVAKHGDFIYIDVTADGFLYKMVRNLTGALLAAGGGYTTVDAIKAILKGRDRTQAPATAPAHGLCLMTVKY